MVHFEVPDDNDKYLYSNIINFIYNDFRGSNIDYKKLHINSCRTLREVHGQRTSVGKICSDNLDELLNWIDKNRNSEYSFCSICEPWGFTKKRSKNVKIDNEYRNKQVGFQGTKINSSGKENSIAEKLIKVYCEEKIPNYVKNCYEPLGFTKEKMNENRFFQLLIIASYDRQPFTRASKGWEPIWGLEEGKNSLPSILNRLNLWDKCQINKLSLNTISKQLEKEQFYGYNIAYSTKEKSLISTDYSKTFKEASASSRSIFEKICESKTRSDCNQIHRLLVDIHGIGNTIASKVIMYTMREIGLGHIKPPDFVDIAGHLKSEYHNSKLIKKMESRGVNFDQLYRYLERDPFALDALYFIDRDRKDLIPLVLI